MSRILIFLYGALVYVFFLFTFLYAIGFIMDWVVPKAINDGAPGPLGPAILVNVMLLGVFAIQHTIMARPAFKRWFTKTVPAAAERSTFVLLTNVILCTMFWQWRPLPDVIWSVDAAWGQWLLTAVACAGWLLVLYSTFLIDHFDLFGLRQVWLCLRGRAYTHRPFAERSAYRLVRHPLMLGFLIAFWSTPYMTGGHLLFAAVVTAYVLVAVRIEERDLVGFLGDDYRAYRKRTPMLLPLPKRRPPATTAPATATPAQS